MNRRGEVPAWLLERLACPDCSDPALTPASGGLECTACGAHYPLVDGRIPVLIPHERTGGYPEAAETRRARQAAYFDHEANPEYEVTRPHGVPVVFGSLLVAKLRRGIAGLETCLPGGTALTVCGGSGMDAEYLARCGARVACADLSLGAARRADQRARRFGLELAADGGGCPTASVSRPIVRSRLRPRRAPPPRGSAWSHFRDGAGRVARGLRQRARGGGADAGGGPDRARRERGGGRQRRAAPPARAGGGGGAIAGFRAVAAERYAVLYRHEAGPIYRLLSRPALSGFALAALGAGDRLLGRVGNKLSVRAVRS